MFSNQQILLAQIRETKTPASNIRWFSGQLKQPSLLGDSAQDNGDISLADAATDECMDEVDFEALMELLDEQKTASSKDENHNCIAYIEEFCSKQGFNGDGKATYNSKKECDENAWPSTASLDSSFCHSLQSNEKLRTEEVSKVDGKNCDQTEDEIGCKTAGEYRIADNLQASKRPENKKRRPRMATKTSQLDQSVILDTKCEAPAHSQAEAPWQAPLTAKGVKMPKMCLFLRTLLQQPEKYTCIGWENIEAKIFKIKNPREVVKLWGSRKHKPLMKYEHFARTLRGYVRKGLLKKPRKKLLFQFV